MLDFIEVVKEIVGAQQEGETIPDTACLKKIARFIL